MFAARRERFLAAMGPDAVAIILGARRATRSNDTEHPFRQNSDFWYLTGFDHPDAVAILRTDSGPRFTLFVQPRDRAAETWTGHRPGVEGALGDHGADAAHDCGTLLDQLPDLLRGARHVHHSLGRRADVDAKLISIQEGFRIQSRAGIAPAAELTDPRSILHEMRLKKEPAELEIMRRAAMISLEAHAEAARQAWPGRFEYELEAQLGFVFRRRGGSGPAYNSIVAAGANAATLHYVANDQQLRAEQMVLVDAGVELEGYASDVTRTYPIGGRYEGACRAIYEIVLAAQEAALETCAPGRTLPQIHDAAIRALVHGMLDLGLLSGSPDELIATEKYKRYYMHGTSHWLGLDVHDAGSYTKDGKPRELEPGMVFTVEPGLYIPADDEQAPESLRGIGVRIEDDVIVNENGIENLTAAIPKRPAEVEAWVNAGRS